MFTQQTHIPQVLNKYGRVCWLSGASHDWHREQKGGGSEGGEGRKSVYVYEYGSTAWSQSLLELSLSLSSTQGCVCVCSNKHTLEGVYAKLERQRAANSENQSSVDYMDTVAHE